MKNELVDEAPTGTLGLAQESGWMNAELFVKWLKHFQKHTKSSIDDPVLLVCDGHASHKSFEAVTYAKENGIAMLCLPPHCTHRMQPLDVSIYGPLKTYFHQEISKWLKNHPGRVVTHLQIGQLFTEAYGKSATIQNATNGFKKTGLWPINPEIFPDYMFAPAETTNIPLNNQTDIAQTLANAPPSALQMHEEDATDDGQIPDSSIEQHVINAEATPSPSILEMDGEATDNDNRPGSSMEPNTVNAEAAPDERPDSSMEQKAKGSLLFPVETISPAPQGPYIQGQGIRKQKPRKHHWHLTSTPNIIELKDANTPKAPPKEKKRKVKKTLFEIPSTSGKQEMKAKKSSRKKKKVEKKIDSDDESSHENALLSDVDDDDDCPCIYCNDLYSRSKPGECWLRCLECSRWAHASCADVPKKTKNFVCELCL
ncbi:uncharacterized protein LOC121728230 [Aricia agestis]|uniref:uncharacterized protein LOC121728230 n=1 Tax=Aricia agestis TaxID=91739 RepID=UPI001C20BD50|nr:uncharacterized protein LOC121728230 [Aricia agestis]